MTARPAPEPAQPEPVYALGAWRVKGGREAEFIRAWRTFTAWTAQHHAEAGEAWLLEDTERPGHFLSVSPWESATALARWRAHSRFASFVAEAHALCEEVQPHTLRLAARLHRPAADAP